MADPNTYFFHEEDWDGVVVGKRVSSARVGWGIARPISGPPDRDYLGLTHRCEGPYPTYADALAAFQAQPPHGP